MSLTLRRRCASIICQMKWRFMIHFDEPPYIWVDVVHPDFSQEQRLAALMRILSRPWCCLDPFIGRKVVKLFKDFMVVAIPFAADAIMRDADLLHGFQDFGDNFHLSNMHTERDLALIKAAAPGKSPSLERLLGAGHLAQILREHSAAGGMYPGLFRRSDLLEAGKK